MPKFMISVGGVYYPNIVFEFKRKLFSRKNTKDLSLPLPSVHIIGEKDEFKEFLAEHELFSQQPLIITHPGGHQFPKTLKDEDFNKLKEFVR